MGRTTHIARGFGALGLLVAVTAGFYHLVLLAGHVVFSRDLTTYFLPVRTFAREQWLSGQLPLWNPHQFGGVPLLGDVTQSLLYPPSLLVLPLSPALGLTVLVVAHHLIAGSGMMLLLRRLGTGWAAATAGAVALAFCGFTVSVTDNVLYLMSFAWTPWVVWAVDRLVWRASLANLLVAAALIALQVLAGDIQGTYVGLVFAGLWGLMRAPRGRRLVAPLVFGVAGVVAAVLAAGQLAATAELFLTSTRAEGVELASALRWSLHPARLAELVAFQPFGSTHGAQTFWAQHLINHETEVPFLYSLYVGLPVLLLALMGLKSRPRLGGLCWLFIATGILGALGAHLPIFEGAREVVPLWSSFRYPVKLMGIVSFCLVLCAGLGLGAVVSHSEGERSRVPPIISLLVAVAAIIGFSVVRLGGESVAAPEVAASVGRSLLGLATVAGVLFFLLVGLRRGFLNAPRFAVLVVLLVTCDLAAAHLGLVRTTPADFFAGGNPMVDALQDHADETLGDRADPVRVYRDDALVHDSEGVDPERVYGEYKLWQRATLVPAVANELNIGYARGNGVTASADARTMWSRLASLGERALSLTGTRYIVADDDEPVFLDGERFETVWQSEGVGVRLVALTDPTPIARVVYGVWRADDREGALDILAAPDFRPRDEIVLERRGARAVTARPATPARILRHGPTRVTIHARAESDGFLLLAESYADDWMATVDGERVEVLRANFLQRAVAVESGDHIVEFVYRPRVALIGIYASAVGWTGLLLGLMWCGWRREERAAEDGE